MALTPFLATVASGAPLTGDAMTAAMMMILEGKVSDVEAAGFLIGLRARGETIEEIAAAARAMRLLAIKVEAPADVIDTAGTGGDGAGTYNISTAAALIAAGAGARVAKHGNKAATSKSGSSQVLEALGVNLLAGPAVIGDCITNAGVGFMFAAAHHKAVANVASLRKQLGVRTMFNLLGPLTNPAGATRQLVGVFDTNLVEPMARVLRLLGGERGWVVHGSDGLDELTITGPSTVCSFDGDHFDTFTVNPHDAGLNLAPISAICGGTPQENAVALRALLNGKKDAYRDISVLNAAAALIIAGKARDLNDGAIQAARAIDSGRALRALEKLVAISNGSQP